MAAELGLEAPDFTLTAHTREPFTLSSERGRRKVVLAFFPAAFSSVCARELCTFRDGVAQLQGGDVAVYGISVDTFFALDAFHRDQALNFPLLSDINKEVIRQYDVFSPDMIGLKGIAKRAVFVIDKAGVIRHREVLEDARNEPDYDQVKAALGKLP